LRSAYGNRSCEGWGAEPASADDSFEHPGRSGPAELAPFGGVAAWSRARPNQEISTALPDDSRGGEIVLKLFVFMQASTAGALARREEGQTMAEYGVLLAVVTLSVVAALTVLSASIRGAFESIAGILPG
jgi:Flp pilus assembly pilin Flp